MRLKALLWWAQGSITGHLRQSSGAGLGAQPEQVEEEAQVEGRHVVLVLLQTLSVKGQIKTQALHILLWLFYHLLHI